MDSQHNVEIKPYATVFIYSTPEGVFGSRVVDFFFFFRAAWSGCWITWTGQAFHLRYAKITTHIYIYIYIYICVCV